MLMFGLAIKDELFNIDNFENSIIGNSITAKKLDNSNNDIINSLLTKKTKKLIYTFNDELINFFVFLSFLFDFSLFSLFSLFSIICDAANSLHAFVANLSAI